MSIYTHGLTCTIPAPLGVIGAAVGRALDPDVGGDKTFTPKDAQYDAQGNITKQPTKLWVLSCPITAEYSQVLPYLLSNPAALRGTIELDFANRFPGAAVPTLAECEAFCAQAVVEFNNQ